MPVLRSVGTRAPRFGVQNFTATPVAAAEAMIASCLEQAAAKSHLSIEGACRMQAQIKKESQNCSNTTGNQAGMNLSHLSLKLK